MSEDAGPWPEDIKRIAARSIQTPIIADDLYGKMLEEMAHPQVTVYPRTLLGDIVTCLSEFNLEESNTIGELLTELRKAAK